MISLLQTLAMSPAYPHRRKGEKERIRVKAISERVKLEPTEAAAAAAAAAAAREKGPPNVNVRIINLKCMDRDL